MIVHYRKIFFLDNRRYILREIQISGTTAFTDLFGHRTGGPWKSKISMAGAQKSANSGQTKKLHSGMRRWGMHPTFSGNGELRWRSLPAGQGCQMAYFQTKIHNLGKFWSVLQRKMLVYFWPLGIFYGHLGYFIVIWYIFSRFGMLYH
jgi:hypothetical protein